MTAQEAPGEARDRLCRAAGDVGGKKGGREGADLRHRKCQEEVDQGSHSAGQGWAGQRGLVHTCSLSS